MKASDLLEGRGGQYPPLLKASALPEKQSLLVVRCVGVRQAPEGFNSPAIMDIEPINIKGVEFQSMPLNVTNLRALQRLAGDDVELDDLYAEITLTKVPVNNPQTGEMTFGLRITDFTRLKGKPKRKRSDVPF